MEREVFRKTAFSGLRSYIAQIIFVLAVLILVLFGLNETEKARSREGLRILEEGIRRAAVTCYTVEGSFPASISYIEENYGVHVDRTKYVVNYEIFASNVLPDIKVIELG